jgi:hypothetical protein
MHRHLIPKFVGAVVLLTALGGGAAYAFTASNTVAPSFAGEGSGTVSGYTVYNISYTGLTTPNAGANLPDNTYTGGSVPEGNTGTPNWIGEPGGSLGLDQQDGVTTVTFQLSPDNATWAAVQLYNSGGTVIGGGGASNCGETGGWWTCNINNGGVAVPMVDIAYLDVEAAQ